MINLTANAIAEVNRIKSSSDQPQDYLRVRVSSGGCAELMYHLYLDDQVNEGDRQFMIPDSELILVTDNQSYQYLEDLQIDFSEDLMGGAFQFKNPQVTSQCSCGISFTIQGEDKK